MDSIFIRIYGGMLASMVIVSVISYMLITQENSRFNEHFHEAIIRGSLLMLADGMARTSFDERIAWYNQAQSTLSLPFSIQSYTSSALSQSDLRKLKQGHVIIRGKATSFETEAWVAVPTREKLLLKVSFKEFSEKQIVGAARLIAQDLEFYSKTQWEALIKQAESYYGFPINIMPHNDLNLSQEEFKSLNNNQDVVRIRNSGRNHSTLSVLLKIPIAEKYLAMGPMSLSNLLPSQLFIVYGIVAVVIMGLVSYYLVRPLIFRLRRLEETAVKIRRDDLSARVTVDTNDALGRLATTFNDMAEHIQRLISAQREMTNAVSHELRTPVARIRFGLEMIEDVDSAQMRSNQIKGIDQDIQELEKLIDEILTYASLEEGMPSLNLQKVEIDGILRQVKKESESLGKSIKVEHVPSKEKSDLRYAECEERYIHRVVQNLVGNAINYANTKVRVSSACEGGMYRIDVEDDGPGIPADKWEKVFIPFARLDNSRTRSSGGYGLGLSIVQRIAYWHGGLASVCSSTIMGGAKFTIIWPRQQSVRKTASEGTDEAKSDKKRFWLQKKSA